MPSLGFGDISAIDGKLGMDGFRSGPRGRKGGLPRLEGEDSLVASHM